jgi:hypothetical protein
MPRTSTKYLDSSWGGGGQCTVVPTYDYTNALVFDNPFKPLWSHFLGLSDCFMFYNIFDEILVTFLGLRTSHNFSHLS